MTHAVPHNVLMLAEEISKRKDRMVELDLEMTGDQLDGEEGRAMYAAMQDEFNALQLLVRSNEVRLRDALRKFAARETSDDGSAQVKNSVGFEDPPKDGDPPYSTSREEQVDESVQNAAQSEDAGRSSG
jgi:hypothetical protein